MRKLAFTLGLLIAFAAHATSPTLGGNGSTTPAHVNTNYSVNIGSPAANDLSVIHVACLDNSASAQPTMSAPSGYSRKTMTNQADAGNFAEQAVFYKIAGGSEGATINVPISNAANFECAAWYYKFTGYNTSTPLDCTDIAWASSATQDPPSQSVAGGPLDVYVTAFGHVRGDVNYSSGSDLTTNAHIDAGGLSTGRSEAVSYGAYSAISSKDPGTFTFSGARVGSAFTCVIYPASTGGLVNPIDGPTKLFKAVR